MNNSPRFLIPTQMIIIQAIGLITANKSPTDHVATDNSADNDDSDTSSYDNSLGTSISIRILHLSSIIRTLVLTQTLISRYRFR